MLLPGICQRLLDAVLRGWLAMPTPVRLLAPVVMMSLLWWSSSRQPEPRVADQLGSFLHNGMHVIAYAMLAGAAWLALVRPPLLRRRCFAAFLVAVGYGIVDEVHQSFVPGRVSSVSDVITDACGAAMALAWLRSRLLVNPAPRFVALTWLLLCALATAFATWGPW